MQTFPVVISTLALATSVLTAWLTLLRRGSIRMTRPSQVHFAQLPQPQILIRTLLFSTAKRGRVIESMHVMLQSEESRHNFNIWVSGADRLTRASGLYVSESGVVVGHYFMVPRDNQSFRFKEGAYKVEVFAKLVDEDQSRSLWSDTFSITHQQGTDLEKIPCGIYFDWGQEAHKYLSHVVPMNNSDDLEKPFELLRLAKEVMSFGKGVNTNDDQTTGVEHA